MRVKRIDSDIRAAATVPDYLDGSLAGDYGWDPLGLGAQKSTLNYYRQAELQNGRWASKALTPSNLSACLLIQASYTRALKQASASAECLFFGDFLYNFDIARKDTMILSRNIKIV